MSNTIDYMSSIDERLDEKLVWAIVFALLIVHFVLAWQAREIGLVSAQDDGRYILLARSLRDFSYRDLYLVGLPYHSTYPPLFPAALAAWGVVIGDSFGGFVLMNIGLSVVALTLAFAAIKRAWCSTGALLCLACMAVNPFLVERPGGVWSETLYIALSFLALWALAERKPSARLLWVVGVAAIAAALTRIVGVTLIGAIGIAWLLERRYKPLATFAVASAVFVGGWLLWGVLEPPAIEQTYLAAGLEQGRPAAQDLTSMLTRRFGKLLPNYVGLTLPWVLATPTIPGTPVDNVVIALVMIPSTVLGLIHLFRRWPAAVIYVLLYGALLLVWPFHRPRFLEPLIPLLLASSLIGIGVVARRFRPAWAMPAVAAAAALLVFGGAKRTADLVELRSSCGAFSLAEPPDCLQVDKASYLRAVDYIGRRTPDGAVFVTAKPEALYYYTKRQSVLLQATLTGDPDRYIDDLRRQGVDYVMLGSLHTAELVRLAPRLEPFCSELEVEAFFPPRTYLFRLSSSGPPGELDACQALDDHRKANANRRFVQDRT